MFIDITKPERTGRIGRKRLLLGTLMTYGIGCVTIVNILINNECQYGFCINSVILLTVTEMIRMVNDEVGLC